jgi:hypothetical protein
VRSGGWRQRSRRRGRAGISTSALLLLATAAGAQTEPPPLTSNRPGIGESEALVPPRAVQLEAGVQRQDAPPGAEQRWTQTWGQLNLRVGVSSRVELFTGWDGLSLDRRDIDGESRIVAGGNDLRIGSKIAVLSEQRHGVTLTVSPAWSFPVGSESFSSSANDGSIRVMWARSLPRDWSVSGNVLFTRTSDTAGRYWDNGIMAGVTRALTSTVSAFVELAGALIAERPDAWTLDAGSAWVARPNLQWDVSAGHTFDHRGDDWFVSAGITIRRPSGPR